MTPVAPSTGGSRLLSGILWIAVAALIASGVFVVALWPETPPDTRPPSTPGALDLGETTCRSVSVSWGKSTDDTDVTGYDIYHDDTLITSVGAGTRSATLTVEPGTTWGLHVNAKDEAGNVSPASVIVPVTPPQCGSDTKAPTTPDKVTAMANGTTVTVSWGRSKDDVKVAAYDIYRDSLKVGTLPSPGDSKTFSYTDVGVAEPVEHRYQVGARDAQGNASARSSVATATTGKNCTVICAIAPVAKETDVISGLSELPGGLLLYTRRDAHEIVRLDPRTGQATVVGTMPGAVSTGGDGGLMGLTIAPTFAKDHWVYVFYSTATDNRIVRVPLIGDELDFASMQSLVVGIPRSKVRNGGRLKFGHDGKIYAATGDAQNPKAAQSQGSLAGKILRFNPDGSIPASNPFGGYIWSYGHRDPQGLAVDAQGRLWEQEFGESVMDETNMIVKGGNYGWPDCEGTEAKIEGGCEGDGVETPKNTYWVEEGSCSGIAIVKNIAYIACLRGARLYRGEIVDGEFASVDPLLMGTFGRLRVVEPGAGGVLWVTTSNGGDDDGKPGNTDGQILKITLPPAA